MVFGLKTISFFLWACPGNFCCWLLPLSVGLKIIYATVLSKMKQYIFIYVLLHEPLGFSISWHIFCLDVVSVLLNTVLVSFLLLQ